MLMFFRRLVGTDPEQCEVQERFKRGLNGFDERAEELHDIDAKLAAVVATVDKKNDSIRAARRTDLSGGHKLNLTITGESCGGNKAGA